MRYLSIITALLMVPSPAFPCGNKNKLDIGESINHDGQCQSGTDHSYSEVNIRLFLSCFPVDAVNANNPLSRDSMVKFEVSLGSPAQRIAVVFPSWLATKSLDDTALSQILVLGDPATPGVPNPLVKEASAFHGMVRLRLAAIPGLIAPDGNDDYLVTSTSTAISAMSFWQTICSQNNVQNNNPDCGGWTPVSGSLEDEYKPQFNRSSNVASFFARKFPYVAALFPESANAGIAPYSPPPPGPPFYGDNFWATSPVMTLPASAALDHRYIKGENYFLSSQIETRWSSDFANLEIHASFPGNRDICGAYYTPLMLFFDDTRPHFTGVSNFKINPAHIKTNWPEAGSPGYFLVLDRNHNGFIDDVSEMFGSESGEYANGFEALRQLDANHDGKIDARDPEFKNLRLWNDADGDGFSQEAELFTLKELGVRSISLNYNKRTVIPMGVRAQLREKAEFTFVEEGRKQKGQVIDVWLSSDR